MMKACAWCAQELEVGKVVRTTQGDICLDCTRTNNGGQDICTNCLCKLSDRDLVLVTVIGLFCSGDCSDNYWQEVAESIKASN